MTQKFFIFTDGGSRGNPGPAALGWVIESEDKSIKKEYGEYIGIKTNNEAEYRAVISALTTLKRLIGLEVAQGAEVIVSADSELLVRQMNGIYKVRHPNIRGFFMEISNLKSDFASVKFRHVYREENKAADRMVNQALDGQVK